MSWECWSLREATLNLIMFSNWKLIVCTWYLMLAVSGYISKVIIMYGLLFCPGIPYKCHRRIKDRQEIFSVCSSCQTSSPSHILIFRELNDFIYTVSGGQNTKPSSEGGLYTNTHSIWYVKVWCIVFRVCSWRHQTLSKTTSFSVQIQILPITQYWETFQDSAS